MERVRHNHFLLLPKPFGLWILIKTLPWEKDLLKWIVCENKKHLKNGIPKAIRRCKLYLNFFWQEYVRMGRFSLCRVSLVFPLLESE